MKRTNGCLGVALLLAFGCSSEASDPAGSEPTIAKSNVERIDAASVPASDLDAVVTANNAFAVDLYGQVLKQNPGKNLLSSPISASLALAMTYAGAEGETKSEIAKVLHLDGLDAAAAFAGQNALSQALGARAASALSRAQDDAKYGGDAPSTADYQLHVVNSVWGDQSYRWATQFLDVLAANYGTGVRQQDFRRAFEPARVSINDWVSENTNDKINDLLPRGTLDETTRIVLVNALHLKLPWEIPFYEDATHSGTFTREDGTGVSADFMSRQGQLAYADDGKAQIVALPLKNRQISVVFALPHAGVTLADYEAGLSAQSPALHASASTALVNLKLPKVNFTTPSTSLGEALQTLGMKQAFDPNAADFTGMAARPPGGERLYVASVLQKAMVAMGEKGVEAAAATAVVLAGNISVNPNPPQPIDVTVDRPYLVALVDEPSGAVLMLGHIQDPSDAGSP